MKSVELFRVRTKAVLKVIQIQATLADIEAELRDRLEILRQAENRLIDGTESMILIIAVGNFQRCKTRAREALDAAKAISEGLTEEEKYAIDEVSPYIDLNQV